MVPGANHFFDGKVEPLLTSIGAYLDKRLEERAQAERGLKAEHPLRIAAMICEVVISCCSSKPTSVKAASTAAASLPASPSARTAKIWRFVYGFDRYYTRKRLAKLPKAARDYIKLHGYQWKNEILLSMDYDTFMNHSENPNTYYRNGFVLARSNNPQRRGDHQRLPGLRGCILRALS